jgi:vacuolar-type H+-ATPase subunit E/Vma4
MDGVTNIISRIELDAQAVCDGIIAESAEQLAQIKADYLNREREVYGAVLRAGAEEGNARYEQQLEQAQREFQENVLAEKRRLLDETFAAAVLALRDLPGRKQSAAEKLVMERREELEPEVSEILFV